MPAAQVLALQDGVRAVRRRFFFNATSPSAAVAEGGGLDTFVAQLRLQTRLRAAPPARRPAIRRLMLRQRGFAHPLLPGNASAAGAVGPCSFSVVCAYPDATRGVGVLTGGSGGKRAKRAEANKTLT